MRQIELKALAKILSLIHIYIGRTDLLRSAVLIFVGIIEKSCFGNDLNRRQGFAVDDAAGKFAAFDIRFYNDFLFIAKGILKRFFIFFFRMYDVYPVSYTHLRMLRSVTVCSILTIQL